MQNLITQPGHPENVLIHAQDNGLMIAVEDGALRHAGSIAHNALSFGPFALASPRNTAAVCQTCGAELARNAMSWKFAGDDGDRGGSGLRQNLSGKAS
jgi:hypothetical protein